MVKSCLVQRVLVLSFISMAKLALDYRLLAAAAKLLQSCQTLCDPIDGSPPGSPVPGILQARTLEWVAISFSNAWKWKVKVKSFSRVWLLATPWTVAHQAPPAWVFPGMVNSDFLSFYLLYFTCFRISYRIPHYILFPSFPFGCGNFSSIFCFHVLDNIERFWSGF